MKERKKMVTEKKRACLPGSGDGSVFFAVYTGEIDSTFGDVLERQWAQCCC
jgi:hypothetical protein